MNRLLTARKIERLVRTARVAEDIMTQNPVSIDHTAKVQQAAVVLSERAISAVPVINEAGRPIGVVSRTDIVRVAGGELGTARCALSCEDCGSSRRSAAANQNLSSRWPGGAPLSPLPFPS